MVRNYLDEMKKHYAEVVSAGDGEKKKGAMSFCPSIWGNPCKLCDHCKEILFNQDKNTPEKIEQAREINRKPKFYANIILPSNPSEVLVFEYGKTIGDKLGLYEMDNNSDFKGFTHPKMGRNMIVIRYPNQDKRKTRYDVEPRLAVSALADMGILGKLYNLDDIPALLKSGLQPLYQSKLTAQRTEIRWLPYWDWRNHPELASVFQVKYFIHYHISEDELAAINRGEFNPLEDLPTAPPSRQLIQPSQTVVVSPPVAIQSAIGPAIVPPTESLWDELMVPGAQAPEPVQSLEKKGTKPGCMGTYDEGEPLCIQRCANKGWLEECKAETANEIAKRRAARGLSK